MMKTGDILTATAAPPATGLVMHKGVYFEKNGEKYVAHNTPLKKNQWGGSVVVEKLDDFLSDGRKLVKTQSSQATVERIEWLSLELKDRAFNTLTFNCEHFTSLVGKGELESPQLFYWLITAVLATGYAFKRKLTVASPY